jgi:hypothetical protein
VSRCSSRSLCPSSVQLDSYLACCVEGPVFTFSFPRAPFLILLCVIVHCARRKMTSELLLREIRFLFRRAMLCMQRLMESKNPQELNISILGDVSFTGARSVYRWSWTCKDQHQRRGRRVSRKKSLASIKPDRSSHERSNVHFPTRSSLSRQPHIGQSSLGLVANVIPILLPKLCRKRCNVCKARH